MTARTRLCRQKTLHTTTASRGSSTWQHGPGADCHPHPTTCISVQCIIPRPRLFLLLCGTYFPRYQTGLSQVCLSLLGTWHGTDASQKWDPVHSSLFQILLSIQGMILISDPYFNEPNVERMRGQAEGTKASNSYNAEIHLNNIRYASFFARIT